LGILEGWIVMVFRVALVVVVLVVGVCISAGTVAGKELRPVVGAIRWDAWHRIADGPKRVGSPVEAMERSLGPGAYNWRLPFFGTVVSENEVRIDGYNQKIVDQEIEYAKAGGIDYWAFLLYEPEYEMSQGLSLYLSSSRKKDMHFCAIASGNTLGNAEQFKDKSKRVIDLMAQPTYQKVLGNRPLLYIFDVSDGWMAAWGGEANAKRLFDEFRASVTARGLGNPYMVVMDFTPSRGSKIAQAIGAEAISTYATAGNLVGAMPYITLADAAKKFWDDCSLTSSQVVPIVMAGWDRRPRIEHPVPWETYQKPGEGIENYYQSPTPKELASLVKDALQFIDANKSKCPARAAIVYAWNEHDEGGWLCPTLKTDGKPNTERLDAIGAMLKRYK